MLLAIDAGNTNTVFALCREGEILHRWRFKSDGRRTADEYASLLLPLLQTCALDFSQIDRVTVSSVVPETNFHLGAFCNTYLSLTPLFVKNDIDVGMEILLDKPEELGADRLVNAVAVNVHYSRPAMVIDFGTATTFDVIDEEGRYAGGAIAPGVNLSLNALHHAAAKLPNVGITKPPQAIGTNTEHAMQSGLYWGYAGLITGMIRKLSAELPQSPVVIATGGLASVYSQDIDEIHHVDDELILKGLIEIQKKTGFS